MKPSAGTLFIILSSVLVIAAIAAGAAIIGSPEKARIRGLDEQRIDALQRLEAAISVYSDRQGKAPPSLQALADRQGGLRPTNLRDPVTDEFYQYRIIGPDSYQLCATFGGPSSPDEEVRWRHGSGIACFAFKIGKAKAPPELLADTGP